MQVDSVKIHNLYAVKNTPLAEWVAQGQVELMELDDYVRTVVDVLEVLPPGCLVERVGGDAPPKYLIGPAWCLDKPRLRAALDAEFERRDTWQGRQWQAASKGRPGEPEASASGSSGPAHDIGCSGG